MGLASSTLNVGFGQDIIDPTIENYFLKNCACTVSFIGFLLLLSWWYGQSSFEQRVSPITSAQEERDSAIQERDDAQRAWADMGTKYERSIETIIKLRDEASKNFKDLPWLNQRHSELAEENIVQYNEIQHLRSIQRKHDELLHDVAAYGMTAKRPEQYQQMYEDLQRQHEISKYHLQKSEKSVKALRETLEAQKDAASKENDWLRASLKKNSRSAAYWAKFRRSGTTDESELAWGIRCACTQPEIAYALKDQTPRIIELEATVAARDGTISRLRASRGNVLKNDASSTRNITETTMPSTQEAVPENINGTQNVMMNPVHSHEHAQHCRDLENQVADDAKTIRQLRKECQDLRDVAPNEFTAVAVDTDAEAQFQGQLAVKAAKIGELEEEKTKTGKELAVKDMEINDLRAKLRSANENAATKISNLDKDLSDTRRDLGDARRIAAEREQELGRQRTEIDELESTRSGLEEAIKQKDIEIEDLENANQEMAEQPAQESAETLQRLKAANTSVEELRHQNTEWKGQLETQAVTISELQAAGRRLEALTKLKDDRIASLEEQISEAPTIDFIENQNQSHNDAINRKNQEYQALYDHYEQTLSQQRHFETRYNESTEALEVVRQNDNAKQLELQHLRIECTNLRNVHSNCEGRMNDLANQLRQAGNVHTDLQVKYNTQATELDTANQSVGELQSKVAMLQQANAALERNTSCSESEAEKYRIEGEDRVRPTWQANFDREVSAMAQKLEKSQGTVFKLENQLQQAKNQASPLREMQLKSREDVIKAREDALKHDPDTMEHDQQVAASNPEERQEILSLEAKLAVANKEAGDRLLRNNVLGRQLAKERKERKDEKDAHEREMKREKEAFEKKSEIQKLRLEKENPLKGAVSKLQNQVARLERELEERK